MNSMNQAVHDLLERSVGAHMTNRESDVRRVEELLQRAGYAAFDPASGPSGMSGYALDRATRDFQRDHGLKQDGMVYTDGPTIQALAAQGRNGDSEIAHLTPGETVVPEELMTPELHQELERAFAAEGLDIGRYTVGGGDDSINPQTGAREFYYSGSDWTDDDSASWSDWSSGGTGGTGSGSDTDGITGGSNTTGGGDDGWSDFEYDLGDNSPGPAIGTGSRSGTESPDDQNSETSAADAEFAEFVFNYGRGISDVNSKGRPGATLGGGTPGGGETLGGGASQGHTPAGLTDGDVEDSLFMDIDSKYQVPSQAPSGPERAAATTQMNSNLDGYFEGLGEEDTSGEVAKNTQSEYKVDKFGRFITDKFSRKMFRDPVKEQQRRDDVRAKAFKFAQEQNVRAADVLRNVYLGIGGLLSPKAISNAYNAYGIGEAVFKNSGAIQDAVEKAMNEVEAAYYGYVNRNSVISLDIPKK